MKHTTFSAMLQQIILYPNKRMTRESWELYSYVTLVDGQCFLKHGAGSAFSIWKPTHNDLLANDWFEWRSPNSAQRDLLSPTMRDQLVTGTPMPNDVKAQIAVLNEGDNDEND